MTHETGRIRSGNKWERLSLVLGWLVGLFIFSANVWVGWGEQQFSYLANSFLHRRLDFVELPWTAGDTVLIEGKYYWPLGPFPAVALMPGVWLFGLWGEIFYQNYLQVFLVAGVALLGYRISRMCGLSKSDSGWLTLAWCGGSTFIGVAAWPWSWFYAQVLTTLLLFLAIREYLGLRRYWLIGIVMAMTLTTRVTAGLGVAFFLLAILMTSKHRSIDWFKLMIPVVFAAMALGVYNQARFGTWASQGYERMIVPEHAQVARTYGVFNWAHVPGNLYFMLLSGPEIVLRDGVSRVLNWPFLRSNPWGMSIFITSPYLLALVWVRHSGWEAWALALTVVVIALPILMYYGVGWVQFGYRYALDFMPWLHLGLLWGWKARGGVPNKYKLLIAASIVANILLLFTAWS